MDMFNRLKSAVTNVLPGIPLARDFDVNAQVASAGPDQLWKVYDAVKKTTKQVNFALSIDFFPPFDQQEI